MTAKKNTELTVDTHCPECDKETAHAVVAAGNGGGRVKCRECGHVHAQEPVADEVAAELDEGEEPDAEEEAFDDEGEGEEETIATAADEPAVEGDLLEGEEKAVEEEAVAEEEDEDDPGVAHLRSRLTDDAEEPEHEEEDEDDEEEEDYVNDEDAAGLSSFGRSSFDEAAEAGEDEPEAPKKKKRAAPKRKTPAVRASAGHQSWEEAVAEVDEKKARSYSFRDTYRPEEIIRHAKFGVGKVVEVVSSNKISVLFKEGRKMMLQGQR